MGIHRQQARFIMREAKYRPINGSVLLIGRQTVHLTPDRFLSLMKEEGVSPAAGISVELDSTTWKGKNAGFISDSYFFKALGADSVVAIDVSDYEGAELVHNLNAPIPAQWENKFDLVCNGSVLDNMFNPVMGLTNISRMAAPGGRIFHFEHASNTVNNAYLQFSPNWFFDYHVVNGFADCKTYVALFFDLNGPWDFYACLHESEKEPTLFRSGRFAMTAVIAEKAHNSTWDQYPTQGQYRSEKEWVTYKSHLELCSSSLRPWVEGKSGGLAARLRGWSHQVSEFLRFLKRKPHAPNQAPGAGLKALLPPGFFSRSRGYHPIGTFY